MLILNSKLAIVTDSTASLTSELLSKKLVFQLPIQIIVDNDSYLENQNITVSEFYSKLKTRSTPAKTSQPSVGITTGFLEQLKSEGVEEVLFIHCSSNMSGTYNSSLTAASMVGLKAYGIDSQSSTFSLEYLVRKAIEFKEEGFSAEDIHRRVSELIGKVKVFLSPKNMDQLKRSGRVNSALHILGNLLSIQLILTFKEGNVVVVDKVRTHKRMKSYLFDLLAKENQDSTINEICVIHGNNQEEAEEWANELKTIYPNSIIHIRDISAAIAVHVGEGSIGACWI